MKVLTDERIRQIANNKGYTPDSREARELASRLLLTLEKPSGHGKLDPVDFKENDDADMCRDIAWDEVKRRIGQANWATQGAGEELKLLGFFCWGWEMRRQYNEQRTVSHASNQSVKDCDAEHVASVLAYIGNTEAGDINSDSVDLRFEVEGVDTGSDASITEYALRGAEVIRKLLVSLPDAVSKSSDKRIKPVLPVRDKMGFWHHPERLKTPFDEDGASSQAYVAWFAERGMDVDFTYMNQVFCADCTSDSLIKPASHWNPESPAGDGWILTAIFDTEEGPCAEWVRYRDCATGKETDC